MGKAPSKRAHHGGGQVVQQQGVTAISTLSSSAHQALLHQPGLGWTFQGPCADQEEGTGSSKALHLFPRSPQHPKVPWAAFCSRDAEGEERED